MQGAGFRRPDYRTMTNGVTTNDLPKTVDPDTAVIKSAKALEKHHQPVSSPANRTYSLT